nr:MAG TPA: hypothetical protein [Caudoviricetes sp.]
MRIFPLLYRHQGITIDQPVRIDPHDRHGAMG